VAVIFTVVTCSSARSDSAMLKPSTCPSTQTQTGDGRLRRAGDGAGKPFPNPRREACRSTCAARTQMTGRVAGIFAVVSAPSRWSSPNRRRRLASWARRGRGRWRPTKAKARWCHQGPSASRTSQHRMPQASHLNGMQPREPPLSTMNSAGWAGRRDRFADR